MGLLRLFEGFGVELEYMLVDARALNVTPCADDLLRDASGEIVAEIDHDDMRWSNELALHVLELKNSEPAATLEVLPPRFQRHVRRVNALLAERGGRLMPTGMHPWMNPYAEAKLWPHERTPVFATLHRVFDCRGHGWANVQSCQLNLPFAGDEEFRRLHAAIRLILPILPALAASSPVVEGRNTGLLDNRLEAYRESTRRVPAVAGRVIPEAIFSREDYERRVFAPIFREMAPHDPDGVLRHEFLNNRGAAARFSRNSIEIRLLDTQECPLADLAICAAVAAVLRGLVEERWTSLHEQLAFGVEPLEQVFWACVRDAEQAPLASRPYFLQFGVEDVKSCPAGELWRRLLEQEFAERPAFASAWEAPLGVILDQGPLARRVLRGLGKTPSGSDLRRVYRDLCDCLAEGRLYEPPGPNEPRGM